MTSAVVLDAAGQPLSPCSVEKAQRLVAAGQAEVLTQTPFTIRLLRSITRTPAPAKPAEPDHTGQRLLLHICCGPCATYSTKRLRELGWDITGYWYNPNIEPPEEYALRRQSLAHYAQLVALPMQWDDTTNSDAFDQAICECETRPERCLRCYRLRLEHTARLAAEMGQDAFTTSLLISPYQDQNALRAIGEELATTYGVPFYFENLRRGFTEHYQLARQYDLYLQRYCGCHFSKREAQLKRGRAGEAG